MRFILGSSSSARLGILHRAGVVPEVVVPGVDEDAIATALGDPTPAELVTALADAKADAVVAQVINSQLEAVVVCCDSVLVLGGEILGKPRDKAEAEQVWAKTAGNQGEVVTGHTITHLNNSQVIKRVHGVRSSGVRFGRPTAEELAAYLASGEPLDVAGGFTIERLGSWFMEGVEGDVANVIGLSLALTRQLLQELGVSVVDLWKSNPPS